MTDRRRNLLVGATVLTAVVILGGMIIKFRELPSFIRPGYELRFTYSDAGSVREGSDVMLAGIRVGRISEITFTEGNARRGVTIIATIDSDIDIPGDVNAYFQRGGLSGGGAIILSRDGRAPGAERKDPTTGGPLAWLPRDKSFTMAVGWPPSGGGGILPNELVTEIREAMISFKLLAGTLNTFFSPPPTQAAATTAPSATTTSAPAGQTPPKPPVPPNFHTTMAKLDAALDAINKNLGDKENQANFKAALENFKLAAAATTEAMEEVKSMVGGVSSATKSASKRFDELMVGLTADADRMGEVLAALHRTAVKIEKGDGTAGRLVNDPALYENFLDAAKQLQSTLKAMQQLLDKWKTEGVKMKIAG
ncbi:MAG: MlaD family protein [Planctomycetota bacterium]|nr:MlaD family protein [Planctomycetota bacterium]